MPLWGIGFFPCISALTIAVPVHKNKIIEKERQKMTLLRVVHVENTHYLYLLVLHCSPDILFISFLPPLYARA